MNLTSKAFNIALQAHKHQKRKGGNYPYAVHLLDVAKYVMYETDKEHVIAAAFLHDVLEDTDYANLHTDFNEEVTHLVLFCTEKGNSPDKSDQELKNSWKSRKQDSINKLNNASKEEALVFVADKVANLLSIKEDLLQKKDVFTLFRASKQDVKWYYTEVFTHAQRLLPNTRLVAVYEDLLRVFD